VKLLFRQSCDCSLGQESLPKPSFHITKAPDMRSNAPECAITIELSCAFCEKPWEGFAGLLAPLKTPKKIIIS
jgi:hypothetical protein